MSSLQGSLSTLHGQQPRHVQALAAAAANGAQAGIQAVAQSQARSMIDASYSYCILIYNSIGVSLLLFKFMYVCIYVMCVVFSSHSFWTSMGVPAGVTQEEGNTGFSIHLLSAVLALIFLARRIQPFLSLVDREVEFCVLTILIALHPLDIFSFSF